MPNFHGTPAPITRAAPRFRSYSTRALILAVPFAMLTGFLLTATPAPVFSQAVALLQVNIETVAQGYRASKLIGTKVKNDSGETIGDIDDIIIDKQRVLFAIIQVGGFLGVGGHLIAVPYESLSLSNKGDQITLPGATKEQLEKLKKFDYGT
jgi:hypothetical protein